MGADPGSGQEVTCRMSEESNEKRAMVKERRGKRTNLDELLGLESVESDLSRRSNVRSVVLVPFSL